jgi:hypothetical protein
MTQRRSNGFWFSSEKDQKLLFLKKKKRKDFIPGAVPQLEPGDKRPFRTTGGTTLFGRQLERSCWFFFSKKNNLPCVWRRLAKRHGGKPRAIGDNAEQAPTFPRGHHHDVAAGQHIAGIVKKFWCVHVRWGVRRGLVMP